MTRLSPLAERVARYIGEVRAAFEAARPGDVVIPFTGHYALGWGDDLELGDAAGLERLRRWDGRLAQERHRRRWTRRNVLFARPWGVVVSQRGALGVHHHGLFAVRPEDAEWFLRRAPEVWRHPDIAPFGTMDGPDRRGFKVDPDHGWAEYTARHIRPGEPVTLAFLPFADSGVPLPYASALRPPGPGPFRAPPSA